MATSRHDDSTKYERANKLNFTSSSEYSTYSNLAQHCDIYPLTRAMRDQLYRSLTPVSTAATMASSSNMDNVSSSADSNHTYEPIENAAAMLEGSEVHASDDGVHHATPFTLIHHDGRRVTANKIMSLDNLRETLMHHERVPYDDPESRGDLYILAPMRLLTPVIEETESEMTKSKLYQSLASVNSQIYSDIDTSIMSIISEVLNLRSDSRLQQTAANRQGDADRTMSRLDTIKEDDANTLLHTIEEIRNNSLCNLYYTSSGSDLLPPPPLAPLGMQAPALVPRVPPRGTSGYKSLTKENQTSKSNLRSSGSGSKLADKTELKSSSANIKHQGLTTLQKQELGLPIVQQPQQSSQQQGLTTLQKQQMMLNGGNQSRGNHARQQSICQDPDLHADQVDLNESLKSVNSNTLVPTPPTVKKIKSPALNHKGGIRKNILNLVGSTNDILNTPKRIMVGNATVEKLSLAASKETAGLSESLMSEHNEFKSLVPHLTSQGAKFLSKLTKTDSDLDQSTVSNTLQASMQTAAGDFSTFSDTPSPKPFVRQIDTNKNIIRRKFSLTKKKKIETVEEVRDDNSDYKYGFMPEHPDAKYGFKVFNPAESYNVVETAKLSGGGRQPPALVPPPKSSASSITATHSYSLSALNRGDTDFRIHPDQLYGEPLGIPEPPQQYANFQRKNWVSNSLQRKPSKGLSDRMDKTRRSMSILDDYEEKENVLPQRKFSTDTDGLPPPPPPLLAKRAPFANVNKISPFKILGTNRYSTGQAKIHQLNRGSLSPKSRIFRKL